MKHCSTCKETKPIEEFYRNIALPDGLQNTCKHCSNKANVKSARKNPEARAEYMRYWRKTQQTPESREKTDLKCKAKAKGLDSGLIWEAYVQHNGLCDICGDAPGKRRLDMDHCHATGVFRGWLCNSCNTGLSRFKDDPRLLRLAAAYLESV